MTIMPCSSTEKTLDDIQRLAEAMRLGRKIDGMILDAYLAHGRGKSAIRATAEEFKLSIEEVRFIVLNRNKILKAGAFHG